MRRAVAYCCSVARPTTQMVQFWPTKMAAQAMPVVAERMNSLPKIVVLAHAGQAHVEQHARAMNAATSPRRFRKIKAEPGEDMAIMGSGTIVSQLTEADLIDEYQIAIVPIVLGQGRTPFEGVTRAPRLTRTHARMFTNGNTFLRYAPVRART